MITVDSVRKHASRFMHDAAGQHALRFAMEIRGAPCAGAIRRQYFGVACDGVSHVTSRRTCSIVERLRRIHCRCIIAFPFLEKNDMPRITPITTKSALAAEHQSVADSVVDVFGHIRGPFSMLLYSPMLAERLLPIVTFVRNDTIIEPGLRFVAILAAARESEAEYVWAAQVAQARSHGIREDLIDLLRSKGDAEKLPLEEREVL